MVSYDLKVLDDKEFECLSIDLHSAKEKRFYSHSNPGPDGGMDGYWYDSKDKLKIIQVKHIDSKNTLNSKLKSEEKIKLDEMDKKPKKYVLYTSCKLQENNKKHIKKIMDPYIKSINDIYDYSDIISLISRYPEIELKYYKLWIASTNILTHTLSEILEKTFNRKMYEVNEMRKKERDIILAKYVKTKDLDNALELLEKNNVLIISGMPGVGKTTLANVLTYLYENKGYKFINLEDIDDYYKLKKVPTEKYIFYFDDFLGSIDYKVKDEKEIEKIISTIKMVNDYSSNKMIITTREFVLNEAKQTSERLCNSDIDLKKMTIDLKNYTKREKLKILTNHIDFHKISKDEISEFVLEKKLLTIINHPHYFPRTIQQSIEFFNCNSKSKLVDEIILNLNNSSRIWEKIFSNKISVNDFKLLTCLYLFNGRSSTDIILSVMNDYGLPPLETKNILKKLEKSLNLIVIKKNTFGQTMIDFFDPSIMDYYKDFLSKNIDHIRFILFGKMNLNFLYSTIDLFSEFPYLKKENNDLYIKILELYLEQLNLQIKTDNDKYSKGEFLQNYTSTNLFLRMYEKLSIKNANDELRIFNIIYNDETNNKKYLEIAINIYRHTNNMNIRNYCKSKLEKFIENLDDGKYDEILDLEEELKEFDLLGILEKKITSLEEDVYEEDFDDEYLEDEISTISRKQGYLEELNEWFENSPFSDAIDNRESITRTYNHRIERQEPRYSKDEKTERIKLNEKDDNEDNQLLMEFAKYYDIKSEAQ